MENYHKIRRVMRNYYLESPVERKARRNKNIKARFQQLTIEEGLPFMEAYEAVGYEFYLSAGQIRDIIAQRKAKCGKTAQ